MTENKPVVLCVDDDRSIRVIVERFLGEEFSVVSAGNGAEALAAVARIRPDVVLLDVMMPDMDGYELCARLQRDRGDDPLPVVFLTALEDDQDRARAFRVGAADFLSKPVRKETLRESVRRILRTSAAWEGFHPIAGNWQERLRESVFLDFIQYLLDRGDRPVGPPLCAAGDPVSDLGKVTAWFGVGEAALARHLAAFLGVPYMEAIEADRIDLSRLPAPFSRTHHVVALKGEEGGALFVLDNPFDRHLTDLLSERFGLSQASGIAIAAPQTILALLEGDVPSRH